MFETRSIAAGAYDWLNEYLFSPTMKKNYDYSNIVAVE